jgi:hypothetical protein
MTFNGQSTVNGQPVANNSVPISVVVGQQIALAAVWPVGTTVQSQSWSQPTGSVAGGYIASNASGCVVRFPNTQAGGCQQPQPCQTLTNSPCVTFYWVGAGAQSVSYNYTLSGAPPGCCSATVTFNVVGPSQPSVTVNVGTVQEEVVAGALYQALDGVPFPDGGTVGMMAQAGVPPPSWPAGSYSWVQLITGYKVQYRGPQLGVQTFSQSALPALDGGYPYPVTVSTRALRDTAADSPSIRLDSPGCGEGQKGLSATTYLLWTPAQGPAIPVPLGSVSWGYGGDSINTLNPPLPVNGWILAICAYPGTPGTPAQPQFQPSATYPEWGTLATIAGSCQ